MHGHFEFRIVSRKLEFIQLKSFLPVRRYHSISICDVEISQSSLVLSGLLFLYIHYFCLDLVGVSKLGQTDFRFIVRLTWVYLFSFGTGLDLGN